MYVCLPVTHKPVMHSTTNYNNKNNHPLLNEENSQPLGRLYLALINNYHYTFVFIQWVRLIKHPHVCNELLSRSYVSPLLLCHFISLILSLSIDININSRSLKNGYCFFSSLHYHLTMRLFVVYFSKSVYNCVKLYECVCMCWTDR